jgi:hypothetical protein
MHVFWRNSVSMVVLGGMLRFHRSENAELRLPAMVCPEHRPTAIVTEFRADEGVRD